MKHRAGPALLLMLGLVSMAVADDTVPAGDAVRDPWARLDQASLSLRGSWWTRSRSLDGDQGVASASAWVSGRLRLPRDTKAVFDGWVRDDRGFQGQATRSQVREAYVATAIGNWDLALGRQLIVWGKADAVNPTDVLSVRDFTLLTPMDEDQKSGVGALRATYNLDDLRLSMIALPEFRSSTLPIPPTPGVRFEARSPDDAWRQFAVRAERSAGNLDWSVSAFDGYERSPDLRFDGVDAQGVRVALAHTRIRMLGADMATTIGRFGVRGEAALVRTDDPQGRDPFIRNPYLFLVAGADRTFLDNLNVNVQVLYRRIRAFEDPLAVAPPLQSLALSQALASNQRDPEQFGATFRILDKWSNDTIEAELGGIVWFARGDWLLRPRLRYAVNDRLKLSIGGDLYRGPADSFLGSLRQLSSAFVEAQYNL